MQDREYTVSLTLTVTASDEQEAIRFFMEDCADEALELNFDVDGEIVVREQSGD